MGDALIREVPRIPPAIDIDTAPYRCYLLNDEWAAHVMGAVSVLTDTGEWSEATDERYGAIQTILEWMEGNECPMYQLRQSPTNPCIMEQSTDGGDTWATAFNYAECQAEASVTNTSYEWNIANEYNITQMTTYNGDIINVYGGWEYGDALDGDRDTAMCYAIRMFVDTICDMMIRSINDGDVESQNQADFWTTASIASGALALGLAGFGIFPVAGLFAGVSLVLSGLVVGAVSTWWTTDTDPYESQAAKDDVVCLIYNIMNGSTPTFANWSSSAQSSLTGDAEKIRNVVHDCMQDETVFVQWLGTLEEVIDAADNGLVDNNCLDCDPDWCYDYDVAGNLSTWSAYAGRAVYSAGWGKGTDNKLIQLLSPVFSSSVHITKITVTMSSSFAATGGHHCWPGGYPGSNQITTYSGAVQYVYSVNEDTDRLAVGIQSGADVGALKIVSIKIEGTGAGPLPSNC